MEKMKTTDEYRDSNKDLGDKEREDENEVAS